MSIDKDIFNSTEQTGGKGNTVICLNKISCSPNLDPSYKRIGIFHISYVIGMDFISSSAISTMNVIGNGGYISSYYSKCQQKICEKINKLLEDNQIVCDALFDFEGKRKNSTVESPVSYGNIACHVFGTLYEKK